MNQREMNKSSKFSLFFLLIFSFLFYPVTSQSKDSCDSKLELKGQHFPFDTSTLNCIPVWKNQGFILRYVKADAKTWNFVLSAPNPNSYIAIGFSPDGNMVGSDAIAGWVGTNGIPKIKKYHLGGQSSDDVVPDSGNLTVGNTTIFLENGHLFMGFQLVGIETPLNRLLYAVGPDGILPSSDNRLVEHKDMVRTSLNFRTGTSQNKDSCDSKLDPKGQNFPFDTSTLNCIPVWEDQGFILRYAKADAKTWNFVLSAPNPNSYIAIGFSANGKMVGSDAIAGWVGTNGILKIKKYHLGGQTALDVVPDSGNLTLGNTTIYLENGHLFMGFQLVGIATPLNRLLYAVGPDGILPSSDNRLVEHKDMVRTSLNFQTGTSQYKDSCDSKLELRGQNFPFDTSTLNCIPVWEDQGFILRYVKAGAKTWNFVLSAPNPNSYIAIGFSPNGNMVGSDAIAGWAGTNGILQIQKYHLGGQTVADVVPESGNLTLGNRTLVLENGHLFMAFQLVKLEAPLSRLLYAVGPEGRLPSSDNRLVEHKDMVRTSFDFQTGQSQTQKDPNATLRRSHGILNMLSWGIMMPIGAMVARYLRQYARLWFYGHIMIQSVAFILGVSGMICGFVLNGRLDNNFDRHQIIGLIVLIFGCLQITAFLARPDKDRKVRKFWSWYHFTVGIVLIIMAAINVFIGIRLADAGKEWKTGYTVVLVILFVSSAILELRLLLMYNLVMMVVNIFRTIVEKK